ncbi:MAG: DUF4083 family protein [Thermacetogeniaceae bacterium]|jgi:preprotein translocase subunit YajC|nr:DUF4083 family protein [Thermoanaerobacterales bacterium]NLN21278.1 DUF4083 family protein [Syntrophomonadaceae bacterium]HAF17280.1 hypothetical protein [Peptococcaceae bacterium]
MEFNLGPLIWSLFNIFLLVVIVGVFYYIYRKIEQKEKLKYQCYKEISDKLDELIQLNKKTIDYFQSKK